MMRIGSGQLVGSMRTAVLLAACAVIVAMTTGLFLAIHLSTADHSADHNSPDCSICQQLAVVSKRIAPAPPAQFAHDAPAFHTDVPESTEHVETRCPRTSRPRSPPCSYQSESA